MTKWISLLLIFSLSLPAEERPKKHRNYFWVPALSLLLPGFDQWKIGRYPEAAVYSGLGIGGLSLTLSLNDVGHRSLSTRNDRERFSFLGAQMYQTAGSLSLLESFRDITREREDFSFKNNNETMFDITTAPFRMDFLIRPTTFIPLMVIGALVAVEGNHPDNRLRSPTGADLFFSTAYSYGAGVGEEALFRGYLMPSSMKWFQSEFWSNSFQAALFAAAHLGNGHVPWPQFLFGWYVGFLSQQKNWTLAEGIFIHTWWDIIAFTADYVIHDKSEPATIRLPQLMLRF